MTKANVVKYHTFETQIEAENILKHEFMGAYWKKLNTKGDVSMFQCKCCDKRLKLQLSVTGDSCQVCVEAFSDKTHDFNGSMAANVVKMGLTQEIKDKIIKFDKLNVKPVAIMEQLRNEGIYKRK
jgi:hypothetical protein